MRILYLTQWFEPEPNIIKGTAFVRALERAGNEVTVVTGFPNYPVGKLYPGYSLRPIRRETIDGVSIVRLPLYPSHDASTVRRSLNYVSFFASALVYCLLRIGRFDLVYVYHPPITVGLAAAIAVWIRRVPLVLDVQDLWPDTIAVSGMRGVSLLRRPIDLLCRFTYRRAAAIVTQSKGMILTLADRGVDASRITAIHNWALCSGSPRAPVRNAAEANTRFTLVYGGNFGRAQGLQTIIQAARLLAHQRQEIEIVMIGNGIEAKQLKQCAAGLPNVQFEKPVSQSEIEAVFANADALLLHLRDEPLFRITIPSKVQAYLAAGQPIVAAIAGEAADLLVESGSALVVPPEDPPALADAISRMADLPDEVRRKMGIAGRQYYLDEFAFEQGMKRTLAVLENAAVSGSNAVRAATA